MEWSESNGATAPLPPLLDPPLDRKFSSRASTVLQVTCSHLLHVDAERRRVTIQRRRDPGVGRFCLSGWRQTPSTLSPTHFIPRGGPVTRRRPGTARPARRITALVAVHGQNTTLQHDTAQRAQLNSTTSTAECLNLTAAPRRTTHTTHQQRAAASPGRAHTRQTH